MPVWPWNVEPAEDFVAVSGAALLGRFKPYVATLKKEPRRLRSGGYWTLTEMPYFQRGPMSIFVPACALLTIDSLSASLLGDERALFHWLLRSINGYYARQGRFPPASQSVAWARAWGDLVEGAIPVALRPPPFPS
jgi:hypothetical protein